MSQLKGVEISLKPIAGGVNRVLPPGINQIMQQEYASRYLESIGAYPTRENVEFVLTNLAIKDALVLPVWARSKILIIPGMNNKDGIEMGSSMQDILSENHNTEESSEKKPFARSKKNEPIDIAALYPDARASYTSLVGRKLSWTTVNTLDLVEPLMGVLSMNRRIAESFKQLLRPPQFESVDIQNSLFTFITSLPDYIPRVRHDKTFELFKSVRRLLKSKQCVQLYGLLIHFCYWNIIHPTARHTIQTLRDAQQNAEEVTFRDVDLSTNGMLQMRNAPMRASMMRPATGGPRTPLSVEKMFLDEVFDIQEEAQILTLDAAGNVTTSHQGMRGRLQSDEASYSRSVSPSALESPPGSPGGKAASPLMREISGLFDPVIGSKKVGFGVIATVAEAKRSSSRQGSKAGCRAGSPTRLGDDVSYLADNDSWAEDRHDGSPSNSPLRSRGFSFATGAGDRARPGTGSRQRDADMGMLGGGGGVGGGGGGEGSLGGVSAETEASLSASEKEQLFMQLEVCLIDLFKQVGRKRVDLVTGRQAMVTCCHFVVDEVLTAAYPWFATLPNTTQELAHTVHAPDYLDYRGRGKDWSGVYAENIKQLNLRLRRLVHQGMADIIDPSRLYTSSMLLSTVTGKVQTQSLSNKGKSRFYTTSVATKAVLGDSHSDAARRFIQQGRGVYTVLPGVVDPYTSRPSVGPQKNATKEFIFDMLRQGHGQGQGQADHLAPLPRQGSGGADAGGGGGGDLHSVDSSSNREGVGQYRRSDSCKSTVGSVVDPPSPSRFTNRFPDNHARSRARPSTSSAALAAQNKYSTTAGRGRGGSANDIIKSGATTNAPVRAKRIDFHNLFVDQPDVGYFPVIKASTDEVSRAAQAATVKHNDWLDEFLPPGSRASTASYPQDAPSNLFAHEDIFPQKGSRPGTSASVRPGTSSSVAMSRAGNFSRPGTAATTATATSRLGTSASHARTAEESQAQLEATFAHTAQMFPSGESIGSGSYLSENRSVAHNKAATMELSLRAKASLMDLIVGKTAALYSTEIQTNLVKTRIALLKKT